MGSIRPAHNHTSRFPVLVYFCLCMTTFVAAQPAQGGLEGSRKTLSGIHTTSVSIYAHPVLTIPLVDSAEVFGLGGSVGLGAEYGFHGNPQPFVSGKIDYAFLPVGDENSSVSLISILAGGGIYFWFTPRFGVKVIGSGGYYFGFLNDGGGASGQFALECGTQLEYILTPGINLALGAAYRYDLGTFQGLAVVASTSFFVGGIEGRKLIIKQAQQKRKLDLIEAKTPEKGRGLELMDVQLYEIFPVFHKFYDDHPVGTALLINQEQKPISDIQLSFYIKQYMDSPKQCPVPQELAGGGSERIEIMSLLTDQVLGVTESTKVAAQLSLEYRMDGDLYRDVRTVTVRLLDRNAMSWDDDRKAAAFVTAKDPAVLAVSKAVAGLVRENGPAALNQNLLTAMGLFTAMELYGLSYVVDPKTPFVEFSKDHNLVDYLQFPRQTLTYKAGDCDDLSILFAALLESVGVETAFVTVPEHIFLAFSTGLSETESSGVFADHGELIIKSGEAWVPLETTRRKGGFMKAWAEGARQWREASSRDNAAFYPLHTAWREYEPVGLPGAAGEIELPDDPSLLSAFQDEVTSFIDREISPRVAQLEERIRTGGGDPATRNKLGILYAHYGRYEQAEEEFRKAVGQEGYVPALVNLGNLLLLQGQATRAREFYEQASVREPENAKVLVGLLRCYHETEQYDLARALYEQLAAVDRSLAERYAYLGGGADGGSRASSVERASRRILWAE
jgi:tetratricopeptide (TPR) repeat protein